MLASSQAPFSFPLSYSTLAPILQASDVTAWLAALGVDDARVRVLRDADQLETVVIVQTDTGDRTWSVPDRTVSDSAQGHQNQKRRLQRAFRDWWEAQRPRAAALPAERGMRLGGG